MAKPKSSYTLWMLGIFLRFLFVLAIAAVWGWLIWRVFFSQSVPGDLKQISDNEALSAAYAEHGGELTLLTQEQVEHTEADDNYAYFNVGRCVFIKEADQVQLLLFYNNSTLERLQQDLQLPELPPRGEKVFDVKLTQYIDVTSDDTQVQSEQDVVTEARVLEPTSAEFDTTPLYTFCRYTFDGVDIEETDTVVVYFDIFYGDEQESRGTLRLYHRESVSEERALKNKERKIIEE